jgi:hypothetical protein
MFIAMKRKGSSRRLLFILGEEMTSSKVNIKKKSKKEGKTVIPLSKK